MDFPGGSAPGGSESTCNAGDLGWEDPLEKGITTHSSILPGELHGLYSPRGHRESNTTERISLHFTGGPAVKNLPYNAGDES